MARDNRDCNHHRDLRTNKAEHDAHAGQVACRERQYTHRGEHRQRRQHAQERLHMHDKRPRCLAPSETAGFFYLYLQLPLQQGVTLQII